MWPAARSCNPRALVPAYPVGAVSSLSPRAFTPAAVQASALAAAGVFLGCTASHGCMVNPRESGVIARTVECFCTA